MNPDPRTSESPFGVHDFLSWNHDWNHYHYDQVKFERTVALLQEARVGWVRIDFLWSDFEPRNGEFEFSGYEERVQQLQKAGISILATLAYSPFWHRPTWRSAPDPVLFKRFAKAVVHRFKNIILHWEIWNEPDDLRFWQPQDAQHSYVELLKQSSIAIKEEDPSALVHLAGLSQGLPASLKAMYAQGAREFFDVVNIHPFVHPLMPDALGCLRYFYESAYRVMQQNGDGGKPLWFTAIGAPGLQDPRRTADWWLGKNPTEIHQAEWVRRLYTDALRWPGVTKIFWSFFRDTEGHFGDGTDFCGLVRSDFSKKPAWNVYAELSRAWAPLGTLPTVVL
jgi:hypothetical protein